MNYFLEKLLKLYNLNEIEYQKMTMNLDNIVLEDYLNFLNMEKGVSRIEKALLNQEKIMIYGDYDCDGITSTSILVYTFKKLNYNNYGYYVPSRYLDGYGINVEMVETIYKKGYKLIITVDNGVAQFEALEKAKELGIDVILTDHHELKEEIPPCYTIIHPFLKKDGSLLKECGAYVSFQLSRALLKETDPYLLSLAALATISDMMPLKSYNRDLVRLGINEVKKHNYLPFHLLLNNEGIKDEKDFSFSCAPKINSLGRVLENRQVNKGVEFFTSNDEKLIQDISKLIEATNNKRKVVALEASEKIDYKKYDDKIFIIDRFDNVSEGLIGLVANKIINEVNKPCIIFTKDHKTGLLKGSARSLNGISLSEIFSKMNDLIVQYGGHDQAGGIVIEEDKLSLFINRINIVAKDYNFIPKEKLIIHCEKEELNYENYCLIRSLSPFGEEFEEPYLSIVFPLKNVSYLKGFKHMRGIINSTCNFIAYNTNKDYGRSGFVELVGRLNLDNFRGGENLSFVVEEIKDINI